MRNIFNVYVHIEKILFYFKQIQISINKVNSIKLITENNSKTNE